MALTSARLTRRPSSTASSRMTSASLMAGRLLLDRLQVLGAHDEGLGLVAVQDRDDEGVALLAGHGARDALEALVRHAGVLRGLVLDGHAAADGELLQHAVGRQDAALDRKS